MEYQLGDTWTVNLMNKNIQHILSEIARLEEELATVIHEQQEQLHYRIEGSKVRFEKNLRKIHHELKTGVFSWLRKSEIKKFFIMTYIYIFNLK